MLGDDNQQEGIFSYVSPEKRVPGDHPLRPIRKMVDEILKEDCAGAAVIWGTPLVLVGQYMIWGRFVYNYWKKQQTYYALTDRRAIIVVNGVGGRTASNAYFENMTIIDKWVRHDGIGSISFGGPAVGEWRWGRNNPPRPPCHSADRAPSDHCRNRLALLLPVP